MKLNEVTVLKSQTILTESWQDLTESQQHYISRWERELWPLLEEYQRLSEATLTADQIKAIFQGAEQQAMAGGDNKTLAGKVGGAALAAAKLPIDVAKKVDDKINELGRMAQNAGPIKNMDAKFDELKKKIGSKDSKIVDGVKKLSEIEDFRFRYYKNFRSSLVDETNLSEQIPLDAESYEIKINETQLENYKNFFQNSYVDEIVMNESRITFFKKYAQPMSFDFDRFGNTEDIQKEVTESFDVNKMPEVMFLSKFIGDFNIQIYGDKYLFETDNKSVVLYNKQYEPK